MTQEIDTAITALMAVVAQDSNIKQAPDKPVEAMAEFPFAVCYPRQMVDERQSSGWLVTQATVFLEFHCARGMLPDTHDQAIALYKAFKANIWKDENIQLGGAVETIGPSITTTYGWLGWGDMKEAHLGLRAAITLKLKGTISS